MSRGTCRVAQRHLTSSGSIRALPDRGVQSRLSRSPDFDRHDYGLCPPGARPAADGWTAHQSVAADGLSYGDYLPRRRDRSPGAACLGSDTYPVMSRCPAKTADLMTPGNPHGPSQALFGSVNSPATTLSKLYHSPARGRSHQRWGQVHRGHQRGRAQKSVKGNQQNAQRQRPGAGTRQIQGIEHAGRTAGFGRFRKALLTVGSGVPALPTRSVTAAPRNKRGWPAGIGSHPAIPPPTPGRGTGSRSRPVALPRCSRGRVE